MPWRILPATLPILWGVPRRSTALNRDAMVLAQGKATEAHPPQAAAYRAGPWVTRTATGPQRCRDARNSGDMRQKRGPVLLEWMAYNRFLGVTGVLICSNDCSDRTDVQPDVLAPLGRGATSQPRVGPQRPDGSAERCTETRACDPRQVDLGGGRGRVPQHPRGRWPTPAAPLRPFRWATRSSPMTACRASRTAPSSGTSSTRTTRTSAAPC